MNQAQKILTPKQRKRAEAREQRQRQRDAQQAFERVAVDSTVLQVSAAMKRWMTFALWSALLNAVLVTVIIVLVAKYSVR